MLLFVVSSVSKTFNKAVFIGLFVFFGGLFSSPYSFAMDLEGTNVEKNDEKCCFSDNFDNSLDCCTPQDDYYGSKKLNYAQQKPDYEPKELGFSVKSKKYYMQEYYLVRSRLEYLIENGGLEDIKSFIKQFNIRPNSDIEQMVKGKYDIWQLFATQYCINKLMAKRCKRREP